jgi:hypothetical protein
LGGGTCLPSSYCLSATACCYQITHSKGVVVVANYNDKGKKNLGGGLLPYIGENRKAKGRVGRVGRSDIDGVG